MEDSVPSLASSTETGRFTCQSVLGGRAESRKYVHRGEAGRRGGTLEPFPEAKFASSRFS